MNPNKFPSFLSIFLFLLNHHSHWSSSYHERIRLLSMPYDIPGALCDYVSANVCILQITIIGYIIYSICFQCSWYNLYYSCYFLGLLLGLSLLLPLLDIARIRVSYFNAMIPSFYIILSISGEYHIIWPT